MRVELVQDFRKMPHREVIEIAVGIAHKLGCNLAHANDVVNVRLHVEVGLRPAGVVGVGVTDVGRLVRGKFHNAHAAPPSSSESSSESSSTMAMSGNS